MKYNNLGHSGLKVSEISFCSWINFGSNLDIVGVKDCMRAAYDRGVNFFDNAEGYARGESEVLMGEALRDFRREDVVITTKIYWGGNGPNDTGLSWKHLVEGTRNSLRQFRLSYIDVVSCHRPDPTTPIAETVRAMDYIIKAGYAFYWGTSEWSAKELMAAYETADRCNCIAPITEQPQYNMFHRDKVEKEYSSVYERHGMGTTIWGPLASGILTGKYNDGVPKGSRLDKNEWRQKDVTPERVTVVKDLQKVADELQCSLSQMAIAWCLKNKNVSSVITGATSVSQLEENIESTNVRDKLDDSAMEQIDSILSKI